MFVDIAFSHNLIAVIVGTFDGKFHNKSSDRNIGLQLTDDSFVTQGTLRRLPNTISTEQIATTRSLDSVVKNVQADRTQPPIIRQTTRRKIAKLMLHF
jgi:hypothetical protein